MPLEGANAVLVITQQPDYLDDIQEWLERIDGVSASFGSWRFNLRSSNTEPLLRLNVEAADEATMARVRDDVLTTIREA